MLVVKGDNVFERSQGFEELGAEVDTFFHFFFYGGACYLCKRENRGFHWQKQNTSKLRNHFKRRCYAIIQLRAEPQ